MAPHEYVNFLANSSIRHQILREVADHPTEPGTLASKCSCSQPTIHRALTKLQDYDWVESVEDGYEITLVGKRVLHQYKTLLNTLSTVMEYPQFFNQLGEEGIDIPLDAVDTSTVVTATPRNPHAPLTYFTTTVRQLASEQCSVVAPVISSEFIEVSEPLVEAGTNLELIFDETVFETVRREYFEELMFAFDTEQIELYIYPDDLSFGLVLFDEQVFIQTYGMSGQFTACLESTDPEFYAWAKDKYTDYRAAAQHIDDTSEYSSE